MAYPPGVTTCPVSIKAPSSFGGESASVYIEITPPMRLIHTATGEILSDFIEKSAPSVGGVATIMLPHSQPGFQNEAGDAVLSWPYTARVRFEHEGQKRHAPLRAFTIAEGQESVDLALIPAGPPIPALTAPSAVVTSINGETGAVLVESLDYKLIARDPSALFVGAITYANGAPQSAAVVWPDGTAGVYTGTPSATFPGSIDAYTITKGATTYTQPAVTRDAAGNITNQPAITEETA
jgi:hypothetical protein